MKNIETTKERITKTLNKPSRTLQASDIVPDLRQLELEIKPEKAEAREVELEDIREKDGKAEERELER